MLVAPWSRLGLDRDRDRRLALPRRSEGVHFEVGSLISFYPIVGIILVVKRVGNETSFNLVLASSFLSLSNFEWLLLFDRRMTEEVS